MNTFRNQVCLPFRVMFHPFDGYERLKYKNTGSRYSTFVILAIWLLVTIGERQLTHFRFNTNNLNDLNIFYILLGTVVVFLLFCLANWSVCTLLDGEGKLEHIWIGTGYALLPYVLSLVFVTLGSHFLTLEESVFLSWIVYVGIIWSAFLLVVGLMQIHQYSFTKTLTSILVTLLGIAFMIFLGFLVITLFQQVIAFIFTIYDELMFRL